MLKRENNSCIHMERERNMCVHVKAHACVCVRKYTYVHQILSIPGYAGKADIVVELISIAPVNSGSNHLYYT